MVLLRALLIWSGLGLASILAHRVLAADEPDPPETQPSPRANRIVTLQFIEPELEMTSPSLKGPEL